MIELRIPTTAEINKGFSTDPDWPHPPQDAASAGGGVRFDGGKARYDLIPPEILEALAHHYGRGAAKYQDRNWEKGMLWCRCFASMMRHAWAWMRGEDTDPETGSHHMVAVAWNATALYVYSERNIGKDDRPCTLPNKEPLNGADTLRRLSAARQPD